jgi:hypothetical protein
MLWRVIRLPAGSTPPTVHWFLRVSLEKIQAAVREKRVCTVSRIPLRRTSDPSQWHAERVAAASLVDDGR